MTDNDDEENSKWVDELYKSPYFEHGVEVGTSFGRFEAQSEAIRAYEAGEIDLWIDMSRPRSREAWDEWRAEHGPIKEYAKRWARDDTDLG